jgi:hypothetical protein
LFWFRLNDLWRGLWYLWFNLVFLYRHNILNNMRRFYFFRWYGNFFYCLLNRWRGWWWLYDLGRWLYNLGRWLDYRRRWYLFLFSSYFI